MDAHDTVRKLSEYVLLPNGWPELGGEFDLLSASRPELPPGPGVYALLINDGSSLRYPNGRTPVIYLGCAFGREGLTQRVNQHRLFSRQCRAEQERMESEGTSGQVFYPRYEWINAAGGVCVYSKAPEGGTSPKNMESLLFEGFRNLHYTLPVANMQESHRKEEGE
ncbi:hypothetical protein ABZ617_17025 [Nocardiopsis alba]|uniref:hypothetical protein n=1 Tax=Nocardiopsis alba TaxID=53437 RepID=UPI0033E843BB